MKRIFLALVLMISVVGFSQYGYRDSNRIGITLGINQFNLKTNDFQTNPGMGWNAGLSIRGNFYNNWDMVYAMQFSENNFSVPVSYGFFSKDLDFNLKGAQITLQLSYRIIENHLYFEFGPLVQINGKLQYDENYKTNSFLGTNIKPDAIVDVNRFNFYPVVGITAGVKHVRLNVTYQYGINNMFGNLEGGYTAHPSIISGNIIFYL